MSPFELTPKFPRSTSSSSGNGVSKEASEEQQTTPTSEDENEKTPEPEQSENSEQSKEPGENEHSEQTEAVDDFELSGSNQIKAFTGLRNGKEDPERIPRGCELCLYDRLRQ